MFFIVIEKNDNDYGDEKLKTKVARRHLVFTTCAQGQVN